MSSELPRYPEAREHVGALKGMGVHVLHDIDATRLDDQREKLFISPHIDGNFDRVVFNFPHVGGGSVKEDLVANQHVLTKFFACSRHLLSDKGEIHVTLRSTSFYESWGIKTLAEKTGLSSLEAVDFDQNAFHGYQQVRTRGSTCMREAPTTSGAKTYRFICPAAEVEKQKTDTTASFAPHKKIHEITSGNTTHPRDGGLCEPGDHAHNGRNTGSLSSEDSDESSSSERGSFTAETNVVARKRELSFEFEAERAHADTNTDTDTDTEVPSASTQIAMTHAKLAAAEKRKRQLLLELRSEMEHFPDAESTQSKRARTSSLGKTRSRRTSESTVDEKQIGEPEEDPLAAMLSQWKQSTTYT